MRDRLPDNIKKDGGTEQHHIADDQEFEIKLKEKLIEEAKELQAAKTREEIIYELADVHKVTQEILKFYTISQEELREIMQKKDEKSGWFDKRIILDEASEF